MAHHGHFSYITYDLLPIDSDSDSDAVRVDTIIIQFSQAEFPLLEAFLSSKKLRETYAKAELFASKSPLPVKIGGDD
ncbi:hypothetical protein BB560_002041 [Smittium megazygosporum]|uniref:Uncharacterized protein n=1 Tax=Smittium megazygosporum TaxID=133381 RepID=A0A2T9ZFU8_9FUNG|nr:hypothetical protein BB560_002041 [Smittium megazygosporum]